MNKPANLSNTWSSQDMPHFADFPLVALSVTNYNSKSYINNKADFGIPG